MEGWLKDRAFHSWANPRDFKNREEWDWAEINAFHSADVAKQILADINKAITDAEYLRKKERGEVGNKFEQYWTGIWPRKS